MTINPGLRYQSAPERRTRILELVRSRSHVSAAELSEELGVSEMTARRDIALLAAGGAVRAVRGGVSRLPHDVVGTHHTVRAGRQPDAKRAIAADAARLVVPDTTVALDVGTTTLELARALPRSIRLSVVTSSLPAMVELAARPEVELIGLGGVLVTESQAFSGPGTVAALRELRVQQAFLGATAVRDGQLLGGNPWDAELKRTLLDVAEQVIVLADATKLRRSAMFRVGALSAADILVTDDGIEPEDRARLEETGLRLIVATTGEGKLGMKALRFHGVGRFGLEELPMPVPGPGEVRVRPAAAGVCGTDAHILDGSFHCVPPVVLGHEIAGFVDAVGGGVLDIREGDLVTVEPHRFCGLCRYCRTGREHLCPRKEAWGVHIDGGMAEAVVVSEKVAYRLPDGTDPRIGALTEPLACCVHAMDRLDPRPGLSLAVFGAGPAGLIMLTLALRTGLRPIVVLEPDPRRRETALAFGADAAIDPFAPDWREQALTVAHADGFDFVLEAVGSPRVLEQGISIAARGARIQVFGVANPGDTATIRPEEIFAKELTILGTVINPYTHHRAVELLPTLGLERLGILTFPLEQHEEAFRAQHERRAGKVQFAPQQG